MAEKKKTPQRLMDSAGKLFAEVGVDGTTIEKIAELSEVSVSSFYTYFKSKQHIAAALVSQAFVNRFEGRDILEELSSGGVLALDGLVDCLFEFVQDNDILCSMAKCPDILVDATIDSILGLRADQGGGECDPDDVRSLTFCLWGVIGVVDSIKKRGGMVGCPDALKSSLASRQGMLRAV